MDVRRVRRGDSGLMYTLVIFVFLFVVSAALAVVFYMSSQEAQSTAEQAQGDLDQTANSQDRNSDLYAAFQQRDAPTVFAAMRNELEGLRTLLVGEADANRESINKRLADVGVQDSDVILHVLTDRNNELERLQGELQSAMVRVSAAEEQLNSAEEQAAEERAEYEARVEELAARISELESDYEAYREQVATQREELSRRLEQARDEAEQEIRNRDNQISQLENRLAQRDSRIRQLIQELGSETPDAPDPSREEDGRIIAVSNERNLAYIDLGRSHHLVLGMRFEVFDRVSGVQVSEDGELRGKATIEIVDISESSAAGRVVRSSLSQPVLPGDPIANLVFDRDRKFKFFVFGEFDLDGDGNYSVSDRETVVTLIREWGGTVVEPEQRRERLAAQFSDDAAEARIVPPDVDFVVIGREPAMPSDLPANERDAVRIQETLEAEDRWEQYNRIVDAAAALSIPVLNENRFLALIGHTGDN